MDDKILKEKWVDALNSGKYQQTTRTLSDEYGYCCLGVLNEIRGAYQNYDGIELLLGCDWGDLATMNDDKQMSFPEIASWIQENL